MHFRTISQKRLNLWSLKFMKHDSDLIELQYEIDFVSKRSKVNVTRLQMSDSPMLTCKGRDVNNGRSTGE